MGIEEYFAQAVDRLLAGESIDDILVSYPPSVRGELRSLLVVVEAAERMATVPVPAPASLNRVSARLLFAQRAAELRGDLVAVSAAAPATALRSTGAATSDKPGLWQRLRDSWHNGWDAIRPPAPLLRLAPLTSVLIITFLLTFTVVVSAQESLPGDQIYRIKEWMFNQRLATAPPELLTTEREIIAKEQVDDVGKTAVELNARPEASAVEAVGTFQYRGEDADFMYFDSLLVTKGYRTDVNDPDSWTPISGNGELLPGINVMLRYQIVPGPMEIVEGISYAVMPEPPQPTPEPTPTPTPVRSVGCQRTEPRGWTAYSLGPNETLRSLAARSNVSSDELRRVNCLTDGPVSAGTTIFVPARIAAPPRPLQPIISATATPTATSLPPTTEPTITPTSTPDGGSSATEPAATELPAATATDVSGGSSNPEGTASATPTDAAATPTDEATPLATKTPAAPESATPANGTGTPGTGTATPSQSTGTPSASPTAAAETAIPSTETPTTGTASPEGSTTPAATASPTGAVSATPTTAPTGSASPAATAVSSPQATATLTAGASPTAAPAASATTAPVATATSVPPTATQGVEPTATDVTSSATGGIAATNTPTVAPTATSIPPTATLPPTATKPPPATATPVPPAPTATPVPPPPTATQPPPATTAASTSDTGESP